MNVFTKFLALCAAVVVVGCVPSLHPVYTESDLVFEPALIGDWHNEDSTQFWTFAKAGETSYDVAFTDSKQNVGRFVGHATKIDGSLFLDLYPAKMDLAVNDLYRFQFVPTHMFIRVEVTEFKMDMSFLNPNWLKESLDGARFSLAHERIGDNRIVITASTNQLREFLKEHQHSEDAFTKPYTLSR